MGAPGSGGQAPDLTMDRQAALGPHKAKGGLRFQPGKPLRGIGLQGEQTSGGSEHHVVPFTARLDQWDDMCWLARRSGSGRGSGTRGRSRRSRTGWRLRWRVKQVGEVSQLLLDRTELSLQGGQPLWQGEQCRGQRWELAGSRQ